MEQRKTMQGFLLEIGSLAEEGGRDCSIEGTIEGVL